MKNAHWARIALAVSTTLGLAGMSSTASAQPDPWQYCNEVAWYNCSRVNGQPTFVTEECLTAEIDACMAGFGTLAAKQTAIGDRRSEVLLAFGPAAAVRPG